MKRFLIDAAEPAGAVPRVRGGTALVVSAALHGAVVLAAFALTRGTDAQQRADADVALPPSVQLMYVPPGPPPAPAPPPRPRAEPRPETPAAPPTPRVPEHDEAAGRPPEAPGPAELALSDPVPSVPAAAEPAPSDGRAPTTAELMRSEAQRLFGRKRRSGAHRTGPTAAPGFEIYLPPREDGCTPAPPRPTGEPVALATVSGRVYRQGTRIPLGGAHLQLIGTPYVTFSNDDGEYDLRFDPSLVDACRTQYVRVTAPGFRAQTLVLYLGPSASNDIPMSQR